MPKKKKKEISSQTIKIPDELQLQLKLEQQQKQYDLWIKKQQTFSNLQLSEVLNISSNCWLPTELFDDNCSSSIIDSNSWFTIKKISTNNPSDNNLYCKYYSSAYELLDKILKEKEQQQLFDEIKEIKAKIKEIDDSHEKFNPLKKLKKKTKLKKVIQFDETKKSCKFIITEFSNDINYGRTCGFICADNSDFCKEHMNKNNNATFDMLAPNTCQHIITQKNGGKNGHEIVDRKGMLCNKFTFNSTNLKYCIEHSKSHTSDELANKKLTKRTFKIRIYPNKEQKKKLEEFFGGARKTTNFCIENDVINEISESEAKTKYVTNIWKDNKYEYLKNIPEDIRAFSVREYYKNCENMTDMYELRIKSEEWKKENYLNYSEKKIKVPEMKFQKKNDEQSINIDKGAIYIKENTITIYPRLLSKEPLKISKRKEKRDKELKKLFEENINHDMKLIKTKTKEYFLCVTVDKEIKEKQQIKSAGAIDVNLRNIGTLYDGNEIYEFGSEIDKQITEMIQEREILKEAYKNDIREQIRGNIENTYKITRERYLKNEQKIKNKINDLHYKVIAKLIECNYSLILIPKLNVTQILKKETTPKITKKVCQTESPSTFLKKLKEKGELHGITIKVVDECMTTQSCGKCYSKYKFREEIYKCKKCGIIMGRDINSSRNIYIKEICKLEEIINYLKKISDAKL